jgi:hypothetical protein
MFNVEIKPEDIDCRGCQHDGNDLFAHCRVCDIRKCAIEKEVENCAVCAEYFCEKLEGFFKMAPGAKDNLERIRARSL